MIYPLMDYCHIYRYDDCQFIGSMNMKGKCVKVMNINKHFRLTRG